MHRHRVDGRVPDVIRRQDGAAADARARVGGADGQRRREDEGEQRGGEEGGAFQDSAPMG